MYNKKRYKYWTKKITILQSESISLIQCFRIQKGMGAVDFSVVLKTKIDERWHFIKRCDSSKKHDSVPHCHIYKLNGKQHREVIGAKNSNLGNLAKAIVDDISDNYEEILENFKHSK